MSTGLLRHSGLAATYLSAAVVVALLLPLCVLFRRYKLAHPESFAKYI